MFWKLYVGASFVQGSTVLGKKRRDVRLPVRRACFCFSVPSRVSSIYIILYI